MGNFSKSAGVIALCVAPGCADPSPAPRSPRPGCCAKLPASEEKSFCGTLLRGWVNILERIAINSVFWIEWALAAAKL